MTLKCYYIYNSYVKEVERISSIVRKEIEFHNWNFKGKKYNAWGEECTE